MCFLGKSNLAVSEPNLYYVQPKSYEELKKRLDTVLTGTQTASKPIAEVLDDEEEYKPSFSSSPSKMENVPFSQEDDEENAMSYFQKLANE